jgi:hypothetical protein
MTRPLRQHRKDILSKEGFLPFEQQALSKNRLESPAMKELRKERRLMLRVARKQFVKEVKAKPLKKGQDPITTFKRRWHEQIRNLYDLQRWHDLDGRINPYARLREIADARNRTQPDWRELYTGIAIPRKKRAAPGEYKKRAEATRKYTVTVTYEIAAGSQKEAEQQAKRQVRNIKKIKVSEVD